MKTTEAIELLRKYKEGNCTEEEKALVETWYLLYKPRNPVSSLSETEHEQDVKEIWAALNLHGQKPRIPWLPRLAAAAIILVAVSAGLYFLNRPAKLQPVSKVQPNILPGGNKAILTLADGSKITLDDAAHGEIAKQAGMSIVKAPNGQLIYSIAKSQPSTSADGLFGRANNSEILYNTIETPKGGQYQINLPDGSKVWLNAASKLRFPASFTGNERKVELSGEAYFEVAKIASPAGTSKKNAAIPFKVVSENHVVEVLGTHFNINAYPDELSIKTTLLEGSVKVLQPASNNSQLLMPGQQARVAETIRVVNTDTQEAIAWKNGVFEFKSQSIASIMRQISRWYDVEVLYQGNIAGETFSGSISRYASVTEVLEMLELTGYVTFKTEGRRITVMP